MIETASPRIFLVLILCCAVFTIGAVNDRDKDVQSVEELQKIELGKYYAGNGRSGGAPKMPVAIQFYNEAGKFFEKGEYALAREAAWESINLEARNPLAWELLGEIENLQQNFDKAQEYYKKSYLLGGSSRVREKLEKLNKEQLIESKFDTYDEEHFIIKYDRNDPKYEGYELRNLLRDQYRSVSQSLGFYINNKIVVLFYKPEDFRYVTGQPHYIAGVYDGKIRLPAYRPGFTEKDMRVTVAHEMTHAFVAYLSGLRAPTWIQEGLAEYQENKIRPIDLAEFRQEIRRKRQIPIDRFLLSQVDAKMQPAKLKNYYQQAFSFTNYLIERFGMYRMKEILQEFGKGSDSHSAIEEVLKISPDRLEKEWLATFR